MSLPTLVGALVLAASAVPVHSDDPSQPRVEVEYGRAVLVQRGSRGELILPDEERPVGRAAYLLVGAGALAHVTWPGCGSLRLEGPVELEWRPGDGDLRPEWAVARLGAVDVEVRSGAPRLELPGGWSARLGRGSVHVSGKGRDTCEVELRAGDELRLAPELRAGHVRPPVVLTSGMQVHLGDELIEVSRPDATASAEGWDRVAWPWRKDAQRSGDELASVRVEPARPVVRFDEPAGGAPAGDTTPPRPVVTIEHVAVQPIAAPPGIGTADPDATWVPFFRPHGEHDATPIAGPIPPAPVAPPGPPDGIAFTRRAPIVPAPDAIVPEAARAGDVAPPATDATGPDQPPAADVAALPTVPTSTPGAPDAVVDPDAVHTTGAQEGPLTAGETPRASEPIDPPAFEATAIEPAPAVEPRPRARTAARGPTGPHAAQWRGLLSRLVPAGDGAVEDAEGVTCTQLGGDRWRIALDAHAPEPVWFFGREDDVELQPGSSVTIGRGALVQSTQGLVRRENAPAGRPAFAAQAGGRSDG
jgi:hypothetical protein